MSAFVLLDDGFAQLADELAAHAENTTKELSTKYMFASHVREYLGFDASCFGAPTDAYPEACVKAQELYAANVRAVDQRYESSEAITDLRFVRRSFHYKWTSVQFIKHLQCLRYQMAEGDVYKSPIYNALDALIADLCAAVVGGLPEYETAAWDIQERAKAA